MRNPLTAIVGDRAPRGVATDEGPDRRPRLPAPRLPRRSAAPPIREPYALPWVVRRERRYRRALALTDLFVAALVLGVSLDFERSTHFSLIYGGALVLVLLWAKLGGLYDRDDLKLHKTTLEEIPRLFALSSTLTLAYVLAERVLSAYETAAPGLVAAWLGLTVGMTLGRGLARRVLERWCGLERCLILAEPETASDLARRTGARGHAEIVRTLPIDDETTGRHELARIVHDERIDRIILAPDASTSAGHAHWIVRRAKQSGARVSMVPTAGGLTGMTGEMDDLGGTVLYGVRRFRPTRSSRQLKRLFDVAASSVVVALTAPLLAVLALLVKLDSRGPAIYRQTRVGRGGRHFRVLKLRTMVENADELRAELIAANDEADTLFKLADDPRITRIGRFLRRSHLDELPQFLNVLKGDMSLVGPRPLIVEEDEHIYGLDRLRLDLTPGITGPWQVLGSGSYRVPMEDMIKLDYVYVTEWSLWKDVVLLVRTAKIVLGRGGL